MLFYDANHLSLACMRFTSAGGVDASPPHFQLELERILKSTFPLLGKDTWKHVSLFFYGCQRLQTSRTIPRLHFCLGAKEYVLIALHMKGFDVNDWEMYQHSRLDAFKVMGGPTSFPHLLSTTN